MRKFKDLRTGAILVTDNEFVIKQYEKNEDRYAEVKESVKSRKEKSE